MALKSVFITGCNRGIGLELGKQLCIAGIIYSGSGSGSDFEKVFDPDQNLDPENI